MEIGTTRTTHNTGARSEQINRQSRIRRAEGIKRQERQRDIQNEIEKQQAKKKQAIELTFLQISQRQAERSGNSIDVKI